MLNLGLNINKMVGFGLFGSKNPVLKYDMVNSSYINLEGDYAYINEDRQYLNGSTTSIDYDIRGGWGYITSGYTRQIAASLSKSVSTNISGSGYNATIQEYGFKMNGGAFAFRVNGFTSNLPRNRVIIDGIPYALENINDLPDGGTRRWAVFELADGVHDVKIQYSEAGLFYGIKCSPNSFVSSLTPQSTTFFFGDSITSNVGASKGWFGYPKMVYGKSNVNVIASGVGGTGYVSDTSDTQYTLSERIVQNYNDVVAESGTPDKVIIAMGVNDIGMIGITTAANEAFDLLRSVYSGDVYVLNAWNANAPLISNDYQNCTDAIVNAIGTRQGFNFIDVSGVAYSKFDAVHPDDAGHATLANFLKPHLL